MVVITFSAKAEGGKDTTAKLVKEQLSNIGYNKVLIVHYADLLKYICKEFFGWNGEKDDAGRTLLQRVGTDVIRKQAPDYWVDFIKSILTMFPNEWDFVLIPDCRFPNEIDIMKQNFNCVSVHISRPNYENHLTEAQRQHPSETALDEYEFDYELINPGNMDGLKQEVETFVDQVFKDNMKKSLIDLVKEKL